MFDRGGITEALDTGMGGGRGHHTIEVIGTTLATGAKGTNFRSWVYDEEGISGSLDATMFKQPKQIAIHVKEDVAVEVTGFNATRNSGGYDEYCTCPECERLQRSERKQSNDDRCGNVFAVDKGIRPEERDVANCIEARENRGLSRRKQEGTLICWKLK